MTTASPTRARKPRGDTRKAALLVTPALARRPAPARSVVKRVDHQRQAQAQKARRQWPLASSRCWPG